MSFEKAAGVNPQYFAFNLTQTTHVLRESCGCEPAVLCFQPNTDALLLWESLKGWKPFGFHPSHHGLSQTNRKRISPRTCTSSQTAYAGGPGVGVADNHLDPAADLDKTAGGEAARIEHDIDLAVRPFGIGAAITPLDLAAGNADLHCPRQVNVLGAIDVFVLSRTTTIPDSVKDGAGQIVDSQEVEDVHLEAECSHIAYGVGRGAVNGRGAERENRARGRHKHDVQTRAIVSDNRREGHGRRRGTRRCYSEHLGRGDHCWLFVVGNSHAKARARADVIRVGRRAVNCGHSLGEARSGGGRADDRDCPLARVRRNRNGESDRRRTATRIGRMIHAWRRPRKRWRIGIHHDHIEALDDCVALVVNSSAVDLSDPLLKYRARGRHTGHARYSRTRVRYRGTVGDGLRTLAWRRRGKDVGLSDGRWLGVCQDLAERGEVGAEQLDRRLAFHRSIKAPNMNTSGPLYRSFKSTVYTFGELGACLGQCGVDCSLDKPIDPCAHRGFRYAKRQPDLNIGP